MDLTYLKNISHQTQKSIHSQKLKNLQLNNYWMKTEIMTLKTFSNSMKINTQHTHTLWDTTKAVSTSKREILAT